MSKEPDYDPFDDFKDDEFDLLDDVNGLNNDPSDLGSDSLDDGAFESDDDDLEESTSSPAPQSAKSTSASAPAPVDQSKPFFKTGLGMASGGLGFLAVVAVGAIAYTSLQGDQIEPPSNYVAQTIEQRPEPDFGLVQSQQPSMPVAAPVATTVQTPAGMVSPLEQQMASADLTAPTPVMPTAPPVQPAQAINNASMNPPPAAEAISNAEILAEIKAQRLDISLLSETIATLSSTMGEMQKTISLLDSNNKLLVSHLEDLAEVVTPAKPEVQKAPIDKGAPLKTDAKPVVVEPQAHADTAGRTRISDLVVIEASASGEMVIIKRVSSDRVFTVFKGEILNIGGNRLTVQGISNNGQLVLVGDKLFIDKTLVAAPVRRPAVTRPAASKPSKAVDAGPVVSPSYTLNAIYDQNQSFGVVDGNGGFHSWKVGDHVPALDGKVTGLDAQGNLKVGRFLIKSIY